MNFLATSGLITIYPSLHWRRLGHENPVCCVKKTSRVTDLLLVKLLKVKLLKGNEEPGKERPFSPIGVLHYLDSLLQAFHTPYSCRGFIKKKKKQGEEMCVFTFYIFRKHRSEICLRYVNLWSCCSSNNSVLCIENLQVCCTILRARKDFCQISVTSCQLWYGQ